MSRKRFHGLKKIKVRATWNKINLYNLSRLKTPSVGGTYYQQKWFAKSLSRGYHGEHIREKQWQRMFKSRAQAVVPMDHKYLAEHDGSEFAAGRGSGVEDKPLNLDRIRFGKNQIPFMHMTYAPIERRLDMAVWRALFASSARQARQFCIHGMVKVNGQKMPYAGYLLNPGDMFQVEPERVLFATGAPKQIEQIRAGRKLRSKYRRINKGIRAAKPPKKRSIMKVVQASSEPEAPKAVVRTARSITDVRAQRQLDFRDIYNKIQVTLETKTTKLGVKRKQELRALSKEVRSARAKVNRKSEQELDDLLKHFNSRYAVVEKKVEPEENRHAQKERKDIFDKQLSEEEENLLQEAITRARENPIDESKPYATPWRPRPYMSAFAFVPRYLEVNHNICSAVYLRHPVARPGLAEVPSPFNAETQQLAFNWYLRRR